MKTLTSFKTIFCFFILSALAGCGGNDPEPTPIEADFSVSKKFAPVGESITYTDVSTGTPTAWEWTFEGGTPATSTEQNPTVTYSQPGFYKVSLKASNDAFTDTELKEDYMAAGFANVIPTELIPYSDVDPQNQVMKVYSPAGSSADKHPLIVLAGGGRWLPSNLDVLASLATRLAQGGYVVASIRYYSQPDVSSTDDALLRNLKGAQDIRAAVRFFRKDAAGANNFKIDPNNIFIGGHGTGAFVALMRAYITADDLDQATVDLFNANGGMEGERGNSGFSSEAKAVISISGAVYDLNAIDSGEMPVLCLHSTGDTEVPYTQGPNSNGTMQFGPVRILERTAAVNILSKLVSVNDTNHNGPLGCTTCFDEVLKFLKPLVE